MKTFTILVTTSILTVSLVASTSLAAPADNVSKRKSNIVYKEDEGWTYEPSKESDPAPAPAPAPETAAAPADTAPKRKSNIVYIEGEGWTYVAPEKKTAPNASEEAQRTVRTVVKSGVVWETDDHSIDFNVGDGASHCGRRGMRLPTYDEFKLAFAIGVIPKEDRSYWTQSRTGLASHWAFYTSSSGAKGGVLASFWWKGMSVRCVRDE